MMTKENTAVEQFLKELERWILQQEKGIEAIKEKRKERKYIEDLLDVLRTSKIGFAIEVSTAKEEKQQEFYHILKKVISDDQEYHRIINEIKNLYYLSELELLDDSFVNPQKETAENAINFIIMKCEDYLKIIEDSKEEERLKEAYRLMESLFTLATKFDDNQLVEEIEDIDFFQEIIMELQLPSTVMLDLVNYVFEKTNELHKKSAKKKKKTNAYQELEDFYDGNSIENTEELLDELLGEKESYFYH